MCSFRPLELDSDRKELNAVFLTIDLTAIFQHCANSDMALGLKRSMRAPGKQNLQSSINSGHTISKYSSHEQPVELK
jgi:hypothetical protein